MQDNTTLYCCYHMRHQYKNNTVLNWIYGPNDPLNRYFSEFSAYRHIYNNDKNSEYIGLCHYRRQLYENDIDYDWLDNEHCITYEKLQSSPNDSFDNGGLRGFTNPNWFNCRWLYFDWLDYIRNINDTSYFEGDECSIKNHIFFQRSIVIMNRYHFMNLCKYILGFFDYLDKKYELNSNPIKYCTFIQSYINSMKGNRLVMMKSRLLAYFGEWLVSNYITTHFKLENIKILH